VNTADRYLFLQDVVYKRQVIIHVQFTGRYVQMLRRNGQTISRYEYFTDLYVQNFKQKNVCSKFSVPFCIRF